MAFCVSTLSVPNIESDDQPRKLSLCSSSCSYLLTTLDVEAHHCANIFKVKPQDGPSCHFIALPKIGSTCNACDAEFRLVGSVGTTAYRCVHIESYQLFLDSALVSRFIFFRVSAALFLCKDVKTQRPNSPITARTSQACQTLRLCAATKYLSSPRQMLASGLQA